MKKDRFGALIRLRSYREKDARRELAASQREVDRTASELKAQVERHESRPPLPRVVSPLQLRTVHLQGVRSLELVAEADVMHEEAQHKNDGTRIAWAQADNRLKSAENLQGKRREEALQAARLAVQAALDQLVLMMRKKRR